MYVNVCGTVLHAWNVKREYFLKLSRSYSLQTLLKITWKKIVQIVNIHEWNVATKKWMYVISVCLVCSST